MYSHVACLLFVCLFKGALSCLSQNIDVEGTTLYFSLRRVAGLWEDGRGEMVCAMTVDEALKMGMTLSDARKVAFATAKTLEGALEVAWKCMPEILKLKKVLLSTLYNTTLLDGNYSIGQVVFDKKCIASTE